MHRRSGPLFLYVIAKRKFDLKKSQSHQSKKSISIFYDAPNETKFMIEIVLKNVSE